MSFMRTPLKYTHRRTFSHEEYMGEYLFSFLLRMPSCNVE